LHAAEERVLFDFVGAADAAETVFCVVDEAVGRQGRSVLRSYM
jgi:hypothetical protein